MAYLGLKKTPIGTVESSTTDAEWLPYGIGIDVHLKFAIIAVTVPDYTTGQVHSVWQKTDINRDAIVQVEQWIFDTLKDLNPPFNFVIESTSTYHFPFIRYFSDQMVPIVINPTIAGKDRKKTDKYDARKLAYHCMTGLWKPTPIIKGDQESLRVLTRSRKKMERSRTILTNRIGTRLCQYGITFSQETKVASNRGMIVIKKIIEGETNRDVLAEYADCDKVHFYLIDEIPDDIKLFLELTYRSVTEIEEKIDILTSQINCMIANNWEMEDELLSTVPGLGPKGVHIYLAEVGNMKSIHRFYSAEAVAAFCGLSPEKKVSAGKMTSHLKRGGNIWIKPTLIQCGQSVMKQDIPLANWGRSIQLRSKEGGYKKAVAAIARRISVYAFHVLRTQKPFDDSKADYTAAERSMHKRLKKINYDINFVELSGDDEEGKKIASNIACQLANRLGGSVFRYAPSEKLMIMDEKINLLGLNKRICNILREENITTTNHLYAAISTGRLGHIKGIGEKLQKECITMMLEKGFINEVYQ